MGRGCQGVSHNKGVNSNTASEAGELSGILCPLFIILLVQSRAAPPNAVLGKEPASRAAGAVPAAVCVASLLAAPEDELGGLLFREAGVAQAEALEGGIALPLTGRSLPCGRAKTCTRYPACALPEVQWGSGHVLLRGELKKVNRAGIKVLAEVLS